MPPNYFEMVGFSEILMLHRRTFGLLVVVKIKVLNLSENH